MVQVILVVDDEPDMCWIMSNIIQSQGFNVVVATTGEDACFKFAHGEFSMMFLDAKLPDMEGLEIAKYARHLTGRSPCIVMVSGYHYLDDPVVQKAMIEGLIRDFLPKPFSNEDLIKILRFYTQ